MWHLWVKKKYLYFSILALDIICFNIHSCAKPTEQNTRIGSPDVDPELMAYLDRGINNFEDNSDSDDDDGTSPLLISDDVVTTTNIQQLLESTIGSVKTEEVGALYPVCKELLQFFPAKIISIIIEYLKE